ncbi:MAG: SMP-30/gluconolactonase/LRE family protein [Pseudomonadota bacterium]
MSEVATSFVSRIQCELGEGPFYCQRRETLYWFDIVNRRRHAFDAASGIETDQQFPEMASAMAVVDETHDLIFTESGLWLRELATGCWTPVCAIEPDDDATRSNDARVHPSGAFWLGTMGKYAQAKAGAIYHFHAGALTKLYADITIPNAICFSPDGATAYFTDTPTRQLMCVSVSPDDGLPTAEPSLHFAQTDDDIGGLDGAICDGDGNIWNARWGSGKIDRYDPSGSRIESIDVPMRQPSCPAFVGSNAIAVTSAWEGMDGAARSADPDAGRTVLLDFQTSTNPRFEPKVVV